MKQRLLELDGLRGVAILLVVFGHYASLILPGLQFFEAATLGVDVFFVLSGFLIGGIILDEHKAPGFLGGFYLRRAARILPIYAVVVTFAFLAQALTQDQAWQDRLFPPWVYATFTTNFAIARVGQAGLMLNPTWSLAVEEQFYLVTPLLMMATPARRLPLVLVGLSIVAIALRLVWSGNVPAAETLLPSRMDALLIGVGAALAQRRLALAGKGVTLLAAAIAPLVLYLPLIPALGLKSAAFQHTAFALSAALLLLAAINGASFAPLLRAPALRFFGEISYGLYLMHQPVRILLTGLLLGKTIYMPGADRIPVTLLALAISVGVAAASWRFFEKPIMESAARWRQRQALRSAGA